MSKICQLYGLSSQQISEVRAVPSLANDLDALQKRVDYRAMLRDGVYGTPGGRGSEVEFEQELRPEVASFFPLLSDFVGRLALAKNGFLIWLH